MYDEEKVCDCCFENGLEYTLAHFTKVTLCTDHFNDYSLWILTNKNYIQMVQYEHLVKMQVTASLSDRNILFEATEMAVEYQLQTTKDIRAWLAEKNKESR